MSPKFRRIRTWSQAACLIFICCWLPAQTTYNIDASGTSFTPDELAIQVGDIVIWTNSSGFHNVNGTQGTYPGNPESFGNEVGEAWVYSFVFTLPGTYDYQCDVHAGSGMVGKVTVEEPAPEPGPDTLTIHFSGLDSLVGRDGHILVVDKESGEILERGGGPVEAAEFSVQYTWIEEGHSYRIDLFVDANGNGSYDPPPVDPAWRLELNDVEGNEVIDFAYNTDFTDIEWMHRMEVWFSEMSPNEGKRLVLFVRDSATGAYLDTLTVDSVPGEGEFVVYSYAIEDGGSYQLDFYVDQNGNGSYDLPPADQAWRLFTGEAAGDVLIEFTYHTEFTDILENTPVPYREAGNGLSIYPNPAAGHITVILDKDPSTEGAIQVLDLTGKIIRTFNLRPANRIIELHIESLQKGTYLLRVRSGESNLVRTFQKY